MSHRASKCPLICQCNQLTSEQGLLESRYCVVCIVTVIQQGGLLCDGYCTKKYFCTSFSVRGKEKYNEQNQKELRKVRSEESKFKEVWTELWNL